MMQGKVTIEQLFEMMGRLYASKEMIVVERDRLAAERDILLRERDQAIAKLPKPPAEDIP